MKVWVAERGCYSDKGLAGVYATADIAKKHLDKPGSSWKLSSYEWMGAHFQEWDNGLDWEDSIRIVEVEVIDG